MQSKYGIDFARRNKLKAYKNVVYACVSIIGEALMDYEPYLEIRKGTGENVEWVRFDHEFFDLLRQPTGRYDPNDPAPQSFSKSDLWESTGIYQQLQGDAFWYIGKGKSTGKPRSITVLRADKVGTDIDRETGKINGYFIRREGADPIPLEIEDVLRFPLFNPENGLKGKSVVEAGADYIETDEGTAEYTKNFFKNGAGLSGVLNIKGEVTKGAFRKFVRAWREKYEGTSNAGKVAVLRESDASFEKIGLGLNELDMSGLRKMSLEDVMMIFKIPAPLLGVVQEGHAFGRGNIETLEYIFSKYNIDKKMERFDNIIQFALQRYYGLDPAQYRVCHENIIPEDNEHKLAMLNAGVDKWITRNEARGDQEAADIEGGNELFVPINEIPLTEAANLTPPAPAASGTTASGLKLSGKGLKVKLNSGHISREKAERFRLTLMRHQAKYERQYKKTLAPIFKDQRAEALKNLEAHASSLPKRVTKAAQQKLFDDGQFDVTMTEALKPMLTDLTQTQGALAMVFAGDDTNEFYLHANVLAHIAESTMRMAGNFNDETIDRLNNTLAEGIQDGEGIGALKNRVGEVFDDVDGYRAERIARTETLKASNEATLEGYRQTGFITGKEWVVNPDACDQCDEFDGKVTGLDESYLKVGASYTVGEGDDAQTYTNDYDDVDVPPLHPNCRCTIIPIREKD